MALMKAWAVVVCTAAWALGVNGQADGSFWWLTSTTTAKPTTTIRCECVPYYLCVDGKISTSGEGILDVRTRQGNSSKPVVNVERCPEALDVCCGLPDNSNTASSASSSHSSTTTHRPLTPIHTTTSTLPPNTPCKCVPLTECKDPKLIVSDNKGNGSVSLFGTHISHSKCHGSVDVCCALETAAQELHDCVCVPFSSCDRDGHIITDGAGLFDPRVGTRSGFTTDKPLPSGECRNPNHECCSFPPTEKPPKGCGIRSAVDAKVSGLLVMASLLSWLGKFW